MCLGVQRELRYQARYSVSRYYGDPFKTGNVGANSMDGQAIDIDKDGDIDMTIAMEFQPNVILINDGTGKFSGKTDSFFPELNFYVIDFQAADFNADGKKDKYICGFRGSDILLFGTKY